MVRIGQGYDSHRFIEGRPLILGGVHVPYEMGLKGHSDADVLTHALIDAILGAQGEEDIGTLFPDSDPAYQGVDSIVLLRKVVTRAHAKGYRIGNADMTLVLERPKMKEYKRAIRERLADALGTSAENVSVKAKTNEGMDAVGNREGVIAYAVVLLTDAHR